MATLLALAVAFGFLLRYAYGSSPSSAPQLSLDKVYDLASRGKILVADLLDEDALVIGQVCTNKSVEAAAATAAADVSQNGAPAAPAGGGRRAPCLPPVKPFQAFYPASNVFTQQLIEKMAAGGAQVRVDKQTKTAIIKLLLTFLFPLLVLANLFGLIFLAKAGDSSMADIAGFGKMGKGKGKKSKKEQLPSTGVTFANVGGAEEAITELREVTDYLKNPKKFEDYGAAAPKGVLLFGPPGCGKTLLARAVAGEAGVPFFPVSGAEFVESLVGVGAARVRDLFATVKEVAPAIVFIDEIDAVGRKRSGEGSTGGEREQTVNQLLVEMDGFEVTAGIVLMGATNRPDILDPALLRPGRFDRHVTLEAPDIHGRERILRLHATDKPLADDVDFEHLARRTSGFTGADLANVINEGALLALRKGSETLIGNDELAEAIQRVMHGPMRRGTIMSGEERKRLAYHESGHALVAAALGHSSEVQRVSIVARGRGLASSSMAESERVLFTSGEMQATLAVTMAGIAAEQVVMGDTSTTSKDDLAKANAMARDMVGVHGMSADVGPLRLLSSDGGYLGSDAKVVEAISGQTLGAFDEAVKDLIEKAQVQAESILTTHRSYLDAMADKLEEEESLEGPALEAMVSPVRPEVLGIGAGAGGDRDVAKPPRRPATSRRP